MLRKYKERDLHNDIRCVVFIKALGEEGGREGGRKRGGGREEGKRRRGKQIGVSRRGIGKRD